MGSQKNQSQKESEEMRREKQRLKKFYLEKCGKSKKASLETRPLNQSEKHMWPRCMPHRHGAILIFL